MMKLRKTWNERVGADPAVLVSRLGPQVACEVKSVMVKVEAFGESSPLRFDVHTAEIDLEKRTGFSHSAK